MQVNKDTGAQPQTLPARHVGAPARPRQADGQHGSRVSNPALTQEDVRHTVINALGVLGDTTLLELLRGCARIKRHSFMNKLLIFSARRNATTVASFATWKKVGRHVKRGERGITILLPMRKMTCALRDAEHNKNISLCPEGERRCTFVGLGLYKVFDITQTVGKPLTNAEEPQGTCPCGLPEIRLALEWYAQSRGYRVTYSSDMLETMYGLTLYSDKRILVNQKNQTADEWMITLIHEIAHAENHKPYDRRPGERQILGIDEAILEAEAEAVAYVVGSELPARVPQAGGKLPVEKSRRIAKLNVPASALTFESIEVIDRTSRHILKHTKRLMNTNYKPTHTYVGKEA